MKYKVWTNDCYLNVSIRAGLGESFDETAMNAFARAALRCFMKAEQISRKKICFRGPIGISLRERLQRLIDKRSFLFILEHTVIAAEKVKNSNLAQDNVVLDLDHVYINELTKELRFLYVPTDKPQTQIDFERFVEMVVYSVKPTGPDTEFVYRFNNFLRGMGRFEPVKIEKFVSQEDDSVVTALRKQYAGLSGYMTNKQKHYYDHYANKEEHSVQKDEEETSVLEDDEATTLLGSRYVDEDATSVLNEMRVDEDAVNMLRGAYADEDATGLLYDIRAEHRQSDYDETGLLTDFEGTMLLEDVEVSLPPEPKRPRANLYRISTSETIKIYSPVFRLGKGDADYVIRNPVVSRTHAEVIDRSGRFYINDLGSRNFTYINGRIVEARIETEIRDGDLLKLANEEFVFHIEQ